MENLQMPSAVNTVNIQWQTDGWRTRCGCRPRLPTCGSPTHGSGIWSAYSCGWDAWESGAPTQVGGSPPTHGSGNCKPPTHQLCTAYAEVLEFANHLRTTCAPPTHHLRTVLEFVSRLRTTCAPPTHCTKWTSSDCQLSSTLLDRGKKSLPQEPQTTSKTKVKAQDLTTETKA